MSGFHGQFVWCELMTTDADAATAFYRSVIGWGANDAGMPDRRYTILSAGALPVGGVMQFPPAGCPPGARTGWLGYIAVDGVDAFVDRVKAAGGTVHREADDIPGVGRFAVVADPQGAVFVLFRALTAGGAPPEPGATPGRVGWHELHAADWQAAFRFYSELFGWTKAEALDMGPMGTYQLVATRDVANAAMMTRTDAVPVPFWLYYFNVDAIDAAAARVGDAGGQVINGPHQVPGDMWIVHCLDPQGGMFALHGPGSATA